MPYFIDSEKDLSIYLAPKNGGTTLRLFLYYIFANIKIEVVNNSYYAGPSEMLDILKSNGYSHSTFKPKKLLLTQYICVKKLDLL